MDFVIKTKGKKGHRIRQELFEIKHQACGNEIIAAIREDEEIKLLKPLYNKTHPRQVKVKVLPAINSVLLVCNGRKDDEQGLLLVEQGMLCGYGFTDDASLTDWKQCIKPISNGSLFHSMVLRLIKQRRYEQMISL